MPSSRENDSFRRLLAKSPASLKIYKTKLELRTIAAAGFPKYKKAGTWLPLLKARWIAARHAWPLHLLELFGHYGELQFGPWPGT